MKKAQKIMKKQVKLRTPDQLKAAYESKETQYTCIVCNMPHDPRIPDNEDFVTFAGDVYVGLRGGIIGGNFNGLGQLNRVMICCRRSACLKRVMDKLLGKVDSLYNPTSEDIYGRWEKLNKSSPLSSPSSYRNLQELPWD
jgi:hypothetical protein